LRHGARDDAALEECRGDAGTIFRAGSKKMRFSPSRSDVSSITFQTFSPTMTPESGA